MNSEHIMGSLALSAVLIAAGTAGSAFAANSNAGYYTTSHYIKSLSYLSGYGSDLATYDASSSVQGNSSINEVIVLDFGAPKVSINHKTKQSTYGTLLFDNKTFASTSQIAASVEQFADSFASSYLSPVPVTLTIGVGTSNYGNQVSNAHGAAWGSMITQINTYLSTKYPNIHIRAVGANDMETGWNGPTTTINWVNGYRGTASGAQLCDYGDMGGFPQASAGTTSYVSGTGNNGWSLEQIYSIADGGINPATNDHYGFALPIIFTTSGSQAKQWFNLDLYTHQVHSTYANIEGVLTEYQADSTTNSPVAGWDQLNNLINSSSTTSGDPSVPSFMQWSTDISWALP